MATRQQLQAALETAFGTNVYFQPPSNLSLSYPCIVYSRVRAEKRPADNRPYMRYDRYSVVYISKTFAEEVPDTMFDTFECVTHDRDYKTDGLYHQVFTIYEKQNKGGN